MRARGIPDLKPVAWNGFPSSKNPKIAMLADLYAFTEGIAIEASDWYLRRRVSPARKSKVLRASAAIFAVVGAVLPLIHSAAPSSVDAEWGFVFLALGGGVVLFDRTFGYSASWTRYARAGLALQRAIANARIEFSRIYTAMDTESPTELEIGALFQVIGALQEGVSGIVEEETNSWMGYLNESLEELTRSTARHTEIPPQVKQRDSF
jgi:hypothetical protein